MLSDAERKKSQRERTAKSRAKRKERSAAEVAAEEERRFEEFNQWRRTERLVSPGEVEAFVDAETCSDALLVAREFLIALGEPDVKSGETLLDVERRAAMGWIKIGAPLLSRITLKFDTSTGSTTDGFTFDLDSRWVPLPGSNEVIDVSTLPVIEVPEVVEASPVADTPAIVEDTVAPTIEQQRAMEHRRQTGLSRVTPQLALMLKTQQDAMDAKAREISARNEARELALEKRLGTYTYEAEKH